MIDTCARNAGLRANVRGRGGVQAVEKGVEVGLRGGLGDFAVGGRGGDVGLVVLSLRDLEVLGGGRGRGPTREDVISVGDGIHASDRSVRRAQGSD